MSNPNRNPYMSGLAPSAGGFEDWLAAEANEDARRVQAATARPVGRPVQSPRPAPRVPVREARTNPFDEAFRVVVGGARDALEGTSDALNDVSEALNRSGRDLGDRMFGRNRYMLFGRDARNGVAEFGVSRERMEAAIQRNREARDRRSRERSLSGYASRVLYGDLPEVAQPTTGVGRFSREVVEFGTSFVGGMRAVRGLGAATRAARFSRPVIASAGAAFVDVDAMEGNLANMAEDLGVPRNVLTDALAVDETDDQLVARFKNAAADAAVGIPLDLGLNALAQGVRQLRGLRAAKQEVDEVLAVPETANTTIALADDVIEAAPAPRADAPADAPATAGDAPKVTLAPTEEADVAAVEIVKRVRSMSVEELDRIADDIMSGNPVAEAAARERLGVHPGRIDFSRLLAEGEGPEAVVQMLTRIAREAAPLAQALGSKPRGWDQTAALADLLGAHKGRITETWLEKTENLDLFSWLARSYIAGQADQLVRAAERAAKYAGSPESPEWLDFMQRLEAQISLQAMARGAASNMGRGLRALAGTAKASKTAQKAEMIRSVLPNDRDIAKGVNTVDEGLRRLADASTRGQREALIKRILKAKGDLRQVVKEVDRAQGPGRFRRAVREVVTGWLFSVGTLTANATGTVLNLGTRLLARTIVHPLGYALGKGMDREWVAARIADEAYFGVFGQSLIHGFQNMNRLLAHELASEGELILSGIKPAADRLAKGRQWLEQNYPVQAKFERVDVVRTKDFAISRETVEELMEAQNHGPAFYRIGMRSLIGVMAGVVNATGASARLIRTATVDASDELFGHTIVQAERMAKAAQLAAREGFDRGLTGGDLKAFVDKRAKVILEESSDELVEQIEKAVAAGAKPGSAEIKELAEEASRVLEVEELSEAEARRVLFQDSLNWEVNKGLAKYLPMLDAKTGLIFPFVQTPLKIMEHVMEELTPLGYVLREDMRAKLRAGGPEAAVVMAQWTLGSMAIIAAATLAKNGLIVGHDGGPRSSTRLIRPAYSIKLGDTWVEYGRLDPMAMLLGFGADLVQYERRMQEEGVEDGHPDLMAGLGSMFMAFSRNILSKTWMTSAQDIIALAGLPDHEVKAGWEKIGANVVGKLVPAGGMARWWEGEDDNVMREASGVWERVIAGSWWMDELPVKRDPLLGRAVPYDRILGIKAKGDPDDPVLEALSDLGFDLPPDTRSFRGVRLSAEQLSRLKELRGQVVRVDGMTFEETLRDAITSGDWREMTREQRVDFISSTRRSFHEEAIRALREEDPEFDVAVEGERLRKQLLREGFTSEAATTELKRFREEVLQN